MFIRRILWHSLIVAALACGDLYGFDITGPGVTPPVIVLGGDASPPVRHAAAELQHFLKAVTGTEIAIVEEAADGRRILVGPAAARLADPDFPLEQLGTDGIILRTVGRDLILAGGEPRGTLYAVYAFLQDEVGCRWWTPDASTIPRREALRVRDLDVRYVPPFNYREPFWDTAFNRDWAVRNKVLGAHVPLDAQVGGRPPMSSAGHSFFHLIPPKRYFEAHPEWFSEVNGKRTPDGQLCLTNDEMRQELTRNVLAQLRKAKNPTHVSVAQNDGGGACQCAQCRALDAEEGSPAGTMLQFVNAVAAEVEKEFPRVLVCTFAYTYSQPAPKISRPRDNVAIWLCTMNCSYNLPLAEHKRNEAFVNDLKAWSRMTRHLYVWDYTTNFRHYLFIHPNLRVLGPNLRLFAEYEVDGVFEQGATGTPGAEFAELRAWVLARLLWNPQLDDKRLISEFLEGYYGPAGTHIQAYIDTIHDAMQAGRQPLGCYEEPDRRFMGIETLAKGWSHLKAGEEAVAADAVLLKRVRLAQMPVMYAFMIRWADLRQKAAAANVPWPMPDDPRAVLAEFKSRAQSIGVKRVSELQTFDKLEEKLKLPQ